MNCLIFTSGQISPGGHVRITGSRARHVCDVLQKRVGDQILAGLLNGPLGMATVIDMANDLVVITMPEGSTPPEAPVDLILAMPRPKVMKRLWAPLASIGLGRIALIGAEKVEPFYFDSHAAAEDTYLPLLIEGLEQARDTHLPEVSVFRSFSWFTRKHLPKLPEDGVRLIGQPGASASVTSVVAAALPAGRVILAVGPEGGWTPNEVEVFNQNGFVPVGMHNRALRTDTAIISLLAVVYEALKIR